jgi:ankyrin repeat protein
MTRTRLSRSHRRSVFSGKSHAAFNSDSSDAEEEGYVRDDESYSSEGSAENAHEFVRHKALKAKDLLESSYDESQLRKFLDDDKPLDIASFITQAFEQDRTDLLAGLISIDPEYIDDFFRDDPISSPFVNLFKSKNFSGIYFFFDKLPANTLYTFISGHRYQIQPICNSYTLSDKQALSSLLHKSNAKYDKNVKLMRSILNLPLPDYNSDKDPASIPEPAARSWNLWDTLWAPAAMKSKTAQPKKETQAEWTKDRLVREWNPLKQSTTEIQQACYDGDVIKLKALLQQYKNLTLHPAMEKEGKNIPSSVHIACLMGHQAILACLYEDYIARKIAHQINDYDNVDFPALRIDPSCQAHKAFIQSAYAKAKQAIYSAIGEECQTEGIPSFYSLFTSPHSSKHSKLFAWYLQRSDINLIREYGYMYWNPDTDQYLTKRLTPLGSLCERNNEERALLLIEELNTRGILQAAVEIFDDYEGREPRYGLTPLCWAANYGNVTVVRKLLALTKPSLKVLQNALNYIHNGAVGKEICSLIQEQYSVDDLEKKFSKNDSTFLKNAQRFGLAKKYALQIFKNEYSTADWEGIKFILKNKIDMDWESFLKDLPDLGLQLGLLAYHAALESRLDILQILLKSEYKTVLIKQINVKDVFTVFLSKRNIAGFILYLENLDSLDLSFYKDDLHEMVKKSSKEELISFFSSITKISDLNRQKEILDIIIATPELDNETKVYLRQHLRHNAPEKTVEKAADRIYASQKPTGLSKTLSNVFSGISFSKETETSLHKACSEGDLESLKLLLALPTTRKKINTRDSNGKTALQLADDHPELVKLLLEQEGIEVPEWTKSKLMSEWASRGEKHAALIKKACYAGDVVELKKLLALLRESYPYQPHPILGSDTGDKFISSFHIACLMEHQDILVCLYEDWIARTLAKQSATSGVEIPALKIDPRYQAHKTVIKAAYEKAKENIYIAIGPECKKRGIPSFYELCDSTNNSRHEVLYHWYLRRADLDLTTPNRWAYAVNEHAVFNKWQTPLGVLCKKNNIQRARFLIQELHKRNKLEIVLGTFDDDEDTIAGNNATPLCWAAYHGNHSLVSECLDRVKPSTFVLNSALRSLYQGNLKFKTNSERTERIKICKLILEKYPEKELGNVLEDIEDSPLKIAEHYGLAKGYAYKSLQLSYSQALWTRIAFIISHKITIDWALFFLTLTDTSKLLQLAYKAAEHSRIDILQTLMTSHSNVLLECHDAATSPFYRLLEDVNIEGIKLYLENLEVSALDQYQGALQELVSKSNAQQFTSLFNWVAQISNLDRKNKLMQIFSNTPGLDEETQVSLRLSLQTASEQDVEKTARAATVRLEKNPIKKMFGRVYNAVKDSSFTSDSEVDTLLHQACLAGDLASVELLLKSPSARKTMNAPNRGGNTPLHIAIQQGHLSVVEFLLRQEGIDVNVENKSNLAPSTLIFASAVQEYISDPEMEGLWHACTTLLLTSPNISLAPESFNPLLSHPGLPAKKAATYYGARLLRQMLPQDTVEALVDHKLLLCANEQAEVWSQYYQKELDKNLISKLENGRALYNGILIQREANHIGSLKNYKPWLNGIYQSELEKKLKELNVPEDCRTIPSFLHVCKERDEFNREVPFNNTLFNWYMSHRDKLNLKKYLSGHPDILQIFLSCAIKHNSPELAADVCASDKLDWFSDEVKALELAAHANKEICVILLMAKADSAHPWGREHPINTPVDQDGNTELHKAVSADNLPLIRKLLATNNINPSALNLQHETPLHIACRDGNVTVVETLLSKSHIEINVENTSKFTPFMQAVCKIELGANYKKIAELLLTKKEFVCTNEQLDKIQGPTILKYLVQLAITHNNTQVLDLFSPFDIAYVTNDTKAIDDICYQIIASNAQTRLTFNQLKKKFKTRFANDQLIDNTQQIFRQAQQRFEKAREAEKPKTPKVPGSNENSGNNAPPRSEGVNTSVLHGSNGDNSPANEEGGATEESSPPKIEAPVITSAVTTIITNVDEPLPETTPKLQDEPEPEKVSDAKPAALPATSKMASAFSFLFENEDEPTAAPAKANVSSAPATATKQKILSLFAQEESDDDPFLPSPEQILEETLTQSAAKIKALTATISGFDSKTISAERLQAAAQLYQQVTGNGEYVKTVRAYVAGTEATERKTDSRVQLLMSAKKALTDFRDSTLATLENKYQDTLAILASVQVPGDTLLTANAVAVQRSKVKERANEFEQLLAQMQSNPLFGSEQGQIIFRAYQGKLEEIHKKSIEPGKLADVLADKHVGTPDSKHDTKLVPTPNPSSDPKPAAPKLGKLADVSADKHVGIPVSKPDTRLEPRPKPTADAKSNPKSDNRPGRLKAKLRKKQFPFPTPASSLPGKSSVVEQQYAPGETDVPPSPTPALPTLPSASRRLEDPSKTKNDLGTKLPAKKAPPIPPTGQEAAAKDALASHGKSRQATFIEDRAAELSADQILDLIKYLYKEAKRMGDLALANEFRNYIKFFKNNEKLRATRADEFYKLIYSKLEQIFQLQAFEHIQEEIAELQKNKVQRNQHTGRTVISIQHMPVTSSNELSESYIEEYSRYIAAGSVAGENAQLTKSTLLLKSGYATIQEQLDSYKNLFKQLGDFLSTYITQNSSKLASSSAERLILNAIKNIQIAYGQMNANITSLTLHEASAHWHFCEKALQNLKQLQQVPSKNALQESKKDIAVTTTTICDQLTKLKNAAEKAASAQEKKILHLPIPAKVQAQQTPHASIAPAPSQPAVEDEHQQLIKWLNWKCEAYEEQLTSNNTGMNQWLFRQQLDELNKLRSCLQAPIQDKKKQIRNFYTQLQASSMIAVHPKKSLRFLAKLLNLMNLDPKFVQSEGKRFKTDITKKVMANQASHICPALKMRPAARAN